MSFINWVSIGLAVACLLGILYCGIFTSILREAIIPPETLLKTKDKILKTEDKITEAKDKITETKDKKRPYSFSRFQLWLWTLIIGPTFVLNWGFVNEMLPEITITSLILLGMSASVSVSAAGITSVQENLIKSHPKNGNAVIKLKKDRYSDGFLTDILKDDNDQLSIVRLQQLIFTFAYVIIYIALFIYCDMENPEFDNSAYLLMGISSGTYLIGKGVNK